jgi:hypothetical protein
MIESLSWFEEDILPETDETHTTGEDVAISQKKERAPKRRKRSLSSFRNELKQILQTTTSEDSSSTETLYDQHLLVPETAIIETERWGYNRYGTNGLSCTIPDLQPIMAKVKNHFKWLLQSDVVLIQRQHSG